MNNTLRAINFAKEHRDWCKRNLPVYESVVAYDLVMLIASKFLGREDITVKFIFSMLPHSYTAIRQHYKTLIKDSWIICLGDESDKRVKKIKPTEKLIKAIDDYALFINKYKLNF